jgi:hypothetical protein
VRVTLGTPAGVYDVEVGLFDLAAQTRLPAFAANGSEISPIILDRLKVRSPLPPIVPDPLPAPIDFGGQIKLLSETIAPGRVTAGSTITLTLYWQAARVPEKDYTAFVHVLDAKGKLVAQADAMPQANRYPTSFWDANEIVNDVHRIDLPSDLPQGGYGIVIGLYDLQSGVRLPMNGDLAGAVQVANFGVTAR